MPSAVATMSRWIPATRPIDDPAAHLVDVDGVDLTTGEGEATAFAKRHGIRLSTIAEGVA
jgi:hypothetical protein